MRVFVALRWAVFLSIALANVAYGQGGAPQIPGHVMAHPPTIDGVIDEAEWKDAAAFEGLRDSDTNQAVPETGHFWLAYDSQFVYFAARLIDPHPESIHATEYATNVDLSGDDSVRLTLDLSGSLSDGNDFEMNPRSATNVRLAGGRAAKREWSGEFVAKGRVTPQGWEIEAKIPWQIMNLPGQKRREVRFNVSRNVPRTQRRYVYGYTGGGRMVDTPRWLDITLPAAARVRLLHLLPYTFGGYDPKSGIVSQSGLDLKTPLAENIELVGTIHPDFRNIENQILSLDFSRFERLAGETRPFFLEGSQYYGSALFASQRIHDFDVGLNSYGKLNDKTQFGLLNTLDFGNENAFNGSLQYDPDPNTSARVALTDLNLRHFQASDDSPVSSLDNQAYLARISRQFGPLNLFLRNMGSHDSQKGGGQDNYASLDYGKQGLDVFMDYTHSSPNFLPRLGFFPEHDYKGPTGGVFYTRPYKSGPLLSWNGGVYAVDYDRINGKPYRTDVDVNGNLKLRQGLGISFDNDHAEFEGVKDHQTTVNLAYPNSDPYRKQTLGYSWGRLDGKKYQSLTLGSAYRPTHGLQLTLNYQIVRHGGQEQQAIFGFNDDLGHNRAASGRIVYQSGKTNGYLAFRRSGNRGAEYYLILGDPNAATFRSSLLLKVVAPFDFRL